MVIAIELDLTLLTTILANGVQRKYVKKILCLNPKRLITCTISRMPMRILSKTFICSAFMYEVNDIRYGFSKDLLAVLAAWTSRSLLIAETEKNLYNFQC